MAIAALLACAACSSGAPFADVIDASYDASWRNGEGDAAQGAIDATTEHAAPDAAPDTGGGNGPDAGADGGGADAGSDAGAAGDAASDAPDGASEAGDAALEAGDASMEAGDAATEAGDAATDAADAASDAGDAGTDAGCTLTSCGVHAACSAGQCVTGYRVFVTNAGTFAGALGGATGADGACQSAASAAGLGGTWKAWVSDPSSSPSTRFNRATVPYRLLDGTPVAASYVALTTGPTLDHPIDLTETGANVGTAQAWTATSAMGTLVANGCSGFTLATGNATPAVVGSTNQTTALWTESTVLKCSMTAHLYCFEQ